MDKKNLLPNQTQPVDRTISGRISEGLADLYEEILSKTGAEVSPSFVDEFDRFIICAYTEDDTD